MYGPIAADHLKQPRNLGRIEEPDGVGHVENIATDTQVTVYLRLRAGPVDAFIVHEARFRAFGCGGCIIAGSVATELATGQSVASANQIDAAAILTALEDGLPADQKYCAELVARAVLLALTDAGL